MHNSSKRLRVALIAGCLSQGGAEKQLVYVARALRAADVDVRVYSLTRDDYYEAVLMELGLEPVWIGRFSHPAARLAAFVKHLCRFRPHIVQSTHFFTNLYATLAARTCAAVAIGSIRNDVTRELGATGRWGPLLLRMPPTILANSRVGQHNAEARGAQAAFLLPNVIDLAAFDSRVGDRAAADSASGPQDDRPIAIAVSRLVPAKRLDRFLEALHRARRQVPALRGVIVGDGPARSKLEAMAADLDLLPDHVEFLGRRSDVPTLLNRAAMLVLCSDHEGTPNVVLEAMAAKVPVITTPAGDAGDIVQENVSGFVVGFDDVDGLAQRIVQLATAPHLRRTLGEAGRRRVQQEFGCDGLFERLLALYAAIARRQSNDRAIRALTVNAGLHAAPPIEELAVR